MKKYSSILFATDFSDCAQKAVESVVDLASALGSTLHVVNVVEPIDVYATRYGTEQTLYYELMKQMRTGAHADIDKLSTDLRAKGLQVIATVREGKPADEIVSYAREHNISLICLSTHGWTGFKHLMLGSTAEKVLRHADCPVFVIRCSQS